VFARVVRFEGVSAAERAVGDDFFREDFLPLALNTAGFEGAYLLVDAERGTSLSITLWASRAALEASDASARHFLAQYATVSGREPTVETFEVAHAHLRSDAAR
jgi:hypothetical protein